MILGHLSNEVSATTICSLVKSGTTTFILGHLSDQNNTPDIAMQTIVCELSQNNINLNDIGLTVACRSII